MDTGEVLNSIGGFITESNAGAIAVAFSTAATQSVRTLAEFDLPRDLIINDALYTVISANNRDFAAEYAKIIESAGKLWKESGRRYSYYVKSNSIGSTSNSMGSTSYRTFNKNGYFDLVESAIKFIVEKLSKIVKIDCKFVTTYERRRAIIEMQLEPVYKFTYTFALPDILQAPSPDEFADSLHHVSVVNLKKYMKSVKNQIDLNRNNIEQTLKMTYTILNYEIKRCNSNTIHINCGSAIYNITYYHDRKIRGGTRDYDGDIISDLPYDVRYYGRCKCQNRVAEFHTLDGALDHIRESNFFDKRVKTNDDTCAVPVDAILSTCRMLIENIELMYELL